MSCAAQIQMTLTQQIESCLRALCPKRRCFHPWAVLTVMAAIGQVRNLTAIMGNTLVKGNTLPIPEIGILSEVEPIWIHRGSTPSAVIRSRYAVRLCEQG